ncbi:MAG: DUF4340 domain-containing protein [Clostridia bacterium]|nr:DUF4340 domain-containing protein [Clostridia bacterium]
MKKRIGIILAAVAVTLCLAGAVFMLYGQDDTPESVLKPSDPYKDISLVINDIKESDVEEVEAKNFPGAPDFAVTVLYDEDEETFSCEMQNNPEDYYYSDTYMDLMVATLLDMEATSIAANGEVNAEDYGITEDSITYVIHMKDGSEKTLRLGKTTPLDSGYYVKLDESDVIYIIGKYEGSTLERDAYEMRSIVIYPTMESYMDLYRMRIEYADGSVVDSRQLSDDEIARGSSYALFKFTEPIVIEINDDMAKGNYYEPALNLSVDQIVTDNKDDLAQYGLDTPDTILFTNVSGSETELMLGDLVEGNVNYRYGTMEDVNCIFTVRGPFDFMSTDIYDLVDTTIWIHSIDDMKTIDITDGTISYSLYIDSFTDTEEASNSRFYAEMDKKALDTLSVRRMYMELVSLPTVGSLADAGLDAETIRKGKPAYKIDFVYDDDSEHYIYLYAINDMQLAADVDGNMLFYTSRSQILKILNYFEMLKNGEIIPEI